MAVILSRTFPGGAAGDTVTESGTYTATQLLSLAYWINLGAIPASGNAIFDGSEFMACDSVNTMRFNANDWSGLGGSWKMANPTTGTWHHIAVTYDYGSTGNTPVMYLDGTAQTVTLIRTPTGSPSHPTRNFDLGNTNPVSATPLNGSLMGFAYWQNVLLSQTDVTNLANGAPPCSIQRARLFRYWPMERGESPEPEVINGSNGTVTGTTTSTGPTTMEIPRCGIMWWAA